MFPIKQKATKKSWIGIIIHKGVHHFRKFSEITSLHGMRYLGEKHMCILERLFWGMVMLSTYSCCAYFAIKVTLDWQASPVLMSLDTQATASWSIPSPAVTVCTTSHISRSKFDLESLCAQQNLSEEMKLQLDVVQDFCGISEDQTREYQDSEAIKYVIKHYLPDVDRVFISITRMQGHINITKTVQKIMTPVSLCYVHNMMPLQTLLRDEFLNVYKNYGLLEDQAGQSAWTPDEGYTTDDPELPPIRLWGTGIQSSTKYLLSVSDSDFDHLCSFGVRGLSVYLHNPAEMPWRVHSNVFLQMNFRVAVFTTPHVISTDDVLIKWSPEKRGCYFENERYLRFFKFYTQRNCDRECEANYTLKYCGCVRLSHPRNINMPICGTKKHECIARTQREMMESELQHGQGEGYCNCLPTCNDIDFEIEKHWRPWNFYVNSSYSMVPSSVDMNSTSISLLTIGAKKKYLNRLKRTAVMGFSAYVVYIGGVISMFIGFSFLNIIEVFYYVTMRVVEGNVPERGETQQEHQRTRFVPKVDYHIKRRPFLP